MNAPPQTQDFLDARELATPDLAVVHRSIEDGWRHGCEVTEVYHRKSDDTYWEATYNHSTDGEYDGLRENTHEVKRVVPQQVTVTHYVDPPAPAAPLEAP